MKSRRYVFSWDFIGDIQKGRPNLGNSVSIEAYRLFLYTMRDVLEESYGTEESEKILYRAGFLAGENVVENYLPGYTLFDDFVAALHDLLLEKKIGILRIESSDLSTNTFCITVSEDVDCSGLPECDHVICTYDEGFVAGLFSSFTGRRFTAKEVDCWCTGDRTCRFVVQLTEEHAAPLRDD
ncbi:V4R domain-containing protein [Desulfovibrio falkowii]|uniref:4-vinyl reductase 4VR n=2 Tax=Desulfovibrio TaxID=872 RepID=B8J3U6_DESDA|nr:V4R domain-containing protein [Desulfovibrio desulfuricans]